MVHRDSTPIGCRLLWLEWRMSSECSSRSWPRCFCLSGWLSFSWRFSLLVPTDGHSDLLTSVPIQCRKQIVENVKLFKAFSVWIDLRTISSLLLQRLWFCVQFHAKPLASAKFYRTGGAVFLRFLQSGLCHQHFGVDDCFSALSIPVLPPISAIIFKLYLLNRSVDMQQCLIPRFKCYAAYIEIIDSDHISFAITNVLDLSQVFVV